MKEIKTYKLLTLAFKVEDIDNLPCGWSYSDWFSERMLPDHFMLCSPCGQFAEVKLGNWMVFQLGMWKQVSNLLFNDNFEECES